MVMKFFLVQIAAAGETGKQGYDQIVKIGSCSGQYFRGGFLERRKPGSDSGHNQRQHDTERYFFHGHPPDGAVAGEKRETDTENRFHKGRNEHCADYYRRAIDDEAAQGDEVCETQEKEITGGNFNIIVDVLDDVVPVNLGNLLLPLSSDIPKQRNKKSVVHETYLNGSG